MVSSFSSYLLLALHLLTDSLEAIASKATREENKPVMGESGTRVNFWTFTGRVLAEHGLEESTDENTRVLPGSAKPLSHGFISSPKEPAKTPAVENDGLALLFCTPLLYSSWTRVS